MNQLMTAIMILAMTQPSLAADPIRPDPRLTPGAVLTPSPPLTALCHPGYTAKVRHVTESMKNEVFRAYGLDPAKIDHRNYEIDHDISLELGGSNDVKNLWPESYVTQPLNAHRKDVLENKLHHLVCSHKIDLATAQREIASDWIAAYQKYVGPLSGSVDKLK